MHQPEGFIRPRDEDSLPIEEKYIWVETPSRQWHKKFDDHVLKNGLCRSKYDECVDIKKREIWLSQSDYIARMIRRFSMEDTKVTATPLAAHFKLPSHQKPKDEAERREMQVIPYANIVGSIIYAMISTKPDVAQAISVTSRFMSDFVKQHWLALKWVMRYLKGTNKFGILFAGKQDHEGDDIVGYCDSDYAGNIDNRKSQTGYIFAMFGAAVSWKSGLQSAVALSTTEAEYIALTSACGERKLLVEGVITMELLAWAKIKYSMRGVSILT